MPISDFWGFVFWLEERARRDEEEIERATKKPGQIRQRAQGIDRLTEEQRIALLRKAAEEKRSGAAGR